MPPFGPNTPEWARQTIKYLLGIEIPSADPAAMRALAQLQETVDRILTVDLTDLLSQIRRKVRTDFSGMAADYYDNSIKQFTTGDNDYLGAGGQTARTSAAELRKGAANAEYMAWMALAELVQLLIEIAWCIAMAYWTMGASLSWIPDSNTSAVWPSAACWAGSCSPHPATRSWSSSSPQPTPSSNAHRSTPESARTGTTR